MCRFEQSEQEVAPYDAPTTTIIEDNTIKDVTDLSSTLCFDGVGSIFDGAFLSMFGLLDVRWQVQEQVGMAIVNTRAIRRLGIGRSDEMFNELTFKKDTILEKLRAGRKEHLEIVQEAQKGYREKLKEELLKKLHALESDERVNPNIRMYVPESHVDDYDRAIEMLELCKEEELTLTEKQFQCLIRNKWSWQHQFLESNMAYSDTATRLCSR